MKLRHHRKRKQRAMRSHIRHTALKRSARRQMSSWFARFIDDRMANHMADAAMYGLQPYQQEFAQSLELSPAEKAAREIVQAAELYDRTLDHYVRPGGLEAIPAPHHMRASRHYYEQRLRAACLIYGPEIRTAARRYSTSAEYEQWLRENPPEVRR